MSLLIKGVQVIDGTGSEPYKADVLVQKNLISAIGNLKGHATDDVVDGLGHYLVPGFIDVHNNTDHYLSLFSNPAQEDLLEQGITTMIGGHCGSSLAPLLYGTLESIRKWTDPQDINVDWHTVSELMASLDRVAPGVNFGTMVGHSTIRRSILGERARLLEKELSVFKLVLTQAMKEGAFGLSTGLEFVHAKKASKKEIKELAAIVEEMDGVYATHLRNYKEGLVDSVNETIEVSQSTGVKTVISHLMPVRKFEKEFAEALKNIEQDSGEVYFDIYPYTTRALEIYTLLPEWAQSGNLEVMLERVRNEKTAKLIIKELKGIPLDEVRVAGVPHHEYLVGKTLRDISKNLGITGPEALLHIMDVTNLRATVFVSDVNEKLMLEALTNERALIASLGNSAVTGEYLKHERTKNTFPRYLELTVGNGKLSITEAVRRITSNPARLFNLKKRGVIKEGNIADLVVLGREDYEVKQVVLGGKVLGRERTMGEILKHTA
jgi:N-acyl-D-amino-acid deacylase